MADKNLLNSVNSSGEVDSSLILDTLMYTDALTGQDYEGKTVEEIVKLLKEKYVGPDGKNNHMGLTDENVNAINNISDYLSKNEHSAVGSLKLSSCSNDLGEDYIGAYGATFYSEDTNGRIQDVYVAFRGTGDGRWVDNGIAFGTKYSEYQQDAAQYFDYAMEHIKIDSQGNPIGADESCNVITTGHSKGGNFSQYVALDSKNAYLVDKVISFDGQGFSPEAVVHFKGIYGEKFYEQQLQKMYSICGDDDPVNVLGVKVIPEEHTTYVVTQKDGELSNYAEGIAGVHAIEWLYNYSNGSFDITTDKQRELAEFAKVLNGYIMTLPREERDAVCRAVMSYIEFGEDYKTGFHGETATLDEHLELWSHIDDIVKYLVYTGQGQDLINNAENDWIKKFLKENLGMEDGSVTGNILLCVTAGFIQSKLTGATYVVEGLLVELSNLISFGAEKIKQFKQVFEFCSNLYNDLKTWWKETFDNDYQAAQEYLGDSTVLKFDTGELHNLAERLWNVNGRLEDLDHRMDSLYRNVKWSDLGKIIKVASADLKIGWSNRINNCANCLNDTANRFESVENQILNMLG